LRLHAVYSFTIMPNLKFAQKQSNGEKRI